ncbi:MAG TPA: trypsin-like peptidase domain-containing protein [Candidatus Acidoferrum sp.]|nr:trypsin-like peptidase domain-containing protein [Candidatus Acidoferrum sp.]
MDTLSSLSNDLADAVTAAARAVVTVNARRRIPSTGVHWRPGIVVTAEHTVRMDDEITVGRPDGRSVPATLGGRDPSTDLAVLIVQDADFPVAALAEPVSLKVGHMVLALGHGPRASCGVVSALGGRWRTGRGGEIDQLIQVDLVLYPGFSGGPLVDTAGRIVGINTSGLSHHLPLAIPASTVTRLGEELIKKGHVSRGYLGVGFHPVRLPATLVGSLGIVGEVGLVVVNLQPDGPAARAGLLLGDIVAAVEGAPVRDAGDVQALLGPERVGRPIRASIVRAGALVEVTITVGERPRPGR